MSKCDFCAATEGTRPVKGLPESWGRVICEDRNACHIRTYGSPINEVATHFEGPDTVVITTTKGYDVHVARFSTHQEYLKYRKTHLGY